MPKLSLEGVNQQLKSAGCRVKLEERGGRISIRGTLPPKPGSDKQKPHQQRFSLNCGLTQAGLREAKAIAFEVSADLDREKFDWSKYVGDAKINKSNCTVAEARQLFKQEYIARRGWNPDIANSYAKHHDTSFNRLPQQEKLSRELLIRVLKNTTKANSHPRLKTYQTYEAVSKLIFGVGLESPHLKGNYNAKEVDPMALPSDEQIEKGREIFLRYPSLEGAYVLMAIYGLRAAECFSVHPESLKDPQGVISVETRKTHGKPYTRLVYPSRLDWYEKWDVKNLRLPHSNAKTYNGKANTISRAFPRLQIGFTSRYLRHAYAVRLAKKNVDTATVAQWMGHSNEVHCRVYRKFLNRKHHDAVFEKYVLGNG